MPSKNSSSSSTPRRSTTPRKTRKKADSVVEENVSSSAAASSNDDLDFGAGIVEDEPVAAAPKPRASRAKAAKATPVVEEAAPVQAEAEESPRETARPKRAPRTRSRAVASEPESVAPPAPESESREFEEKRPAREERSSRDDSYELPFDFDGGDHGDDDDHDSASEGGENAARDGEGDDRRPRRRRRRRGRRNEPGQVQQGNGTGQQGNSAGQQGTGGNSGQFRQERQGGGNRQGGGYGQQRDNNNRNGGRRDQQRGGRSNVNSNSNNRGRRVSKFEQNAAPSEPVAMTGTITGVLELHPKGYGFLRSGDNDYSARETDAFVSSSFVEKHHLREGIMLTGDIGPGTRGQGPRLLTINSIDGGSVEDYEKLKHFDTLTAINPFEQIKLETGPKSITMRVMDLLTPIGKGQRALIVAPPRTGKTMLLQDIANSVSVNHPEIHLIVLLIDERPEEVTEMRRTVKGEVIASSMDQDVESHVRISQLIIERGKRLAEAGKDCFILMDSITRTARAFNKWVRGGRDSKIQTGGLDVRAMDIPRKMFGTARRFDEGGSLTVCATALIDTGSRMDDAIFQEFKGTGNMELVLSRDLAERRIWPALDISRSGTRREEKILDPDLLDGIIMLRRSLVSMNPTEAMDQLIRTLAKFDSNREFLQRIRSVL
ncbi:transcription termination factor Rho [Planctomicrobium sp. SH668]|uniref:transcription termination factor Rho n=1 Tax=Planctomicrobium sp. SH668 TaxID=3448126 RepID=UPI003F5B2C93